MTDSQRHRCRPPLRPVTAGILWVSLLLLWSLAGVAAGSQVDRLRETIERLASVDSRVAGYPGCKGAGEFVQQEFVRWGVKEVQREVFPVTVPVDHGGSLVLVEDGEEFPIWGVWPNQIRTPSLPPTGLRAPMLDGGDGSFGAYGGKKLEGRVVLLDFNTWRRWLRPAWLGASAVVFVEPQETSWRQGAEKYLEIPLDMPRFWISRSAAERVRARIGDGEAEVLLRSRMTWERRQTANIVGIVPGRDPELRADTVAVEAYYDGISVVPGLAPSAESACSIAGLLELVRYLHEHPPGRTVVVAATSGHFQDMQGMAAFLDRHARKFGPFAEKVPEPLHIDLFIGLDLSSQTDQVGLWNNTTQFALKRYFVPFGRWYTRYAEATAPGLGLDPESALVNGISAIRGMEWSSYVPGGIRVDGQTALDGGLPALSFVTVYDGRFHIDSPLDRPAGVNYANLSSQVSLLTRILSRSFDDPTFMTELEDFSPVLRDKLRSLNVRVRSYLRQNQVPDEPVRNSIVVVGPQDWRSAPVKGVRTHRYYHTDQRAETTVPGLIAGTYAINAYVLAPETGEIIVAPDLSARAQKHHGKPLGSGGGHLVASATAARNEKTIVGFPCVSREIYDVVSPQFLTPLSAIGVLDAKNVPPRQFGYALGSGTGVVFAMPGSEADNRTKIVIGKAMLLLNSEGSGSEDEARGAGYLLEQTPLTHTTMLAAQDMWNLNEVRLRRMRDNAVENKRVVVLHEWAGQLITKAREARKSLDWDRYAAYAREALGVEARAYPEVVGTLNDLIHGMVFFLALVIPAAFFGERLLIGAADIRRQLVGVFAMLLLIWAAISQVHPAFAIGHPLVILLSFAIMATASFVMALVFSRFEAHVQEMQSQATGVYHMDVSRVGASYVAFMLGISNMRRRKLRTTLTLVTLVLLTFTVLSFTSFEARVRFLSVPMANPGSYEGMLVRDLGWNRLSHTMLDYAESHFGAEGVVSPRNWFISTSESGEQNKTYLEAVHGNRAARVLGLLGLTPLEVRVTEADQALRAGSFFEEAYEATCLISDAMAADLGITAAEIGHATVRLLGKELTVRGIIDAKKLAGVSDLDGEPLTPVDFALSMSATLDSDLPKARSDPAAVSEMRAFTHLTPENVLVLPYDTLRDMGGDLRSVGVRFEDGVRGRQLMEDYLLRLAVTLYAGFRQADSDEIAVSSYTSIGTTAVEGLGSLIVPVIIAGLIVLNTMLGAVYERFREIGIYSSVGLAPSHIAMLFIAEACVYAVLGVTLGYLLGQGIGKLLISFDLLGGMNLNYSSLAAVFSSMLVMAVVLVSTIYPARLAARAAVPDVVRRWVPPPPTGKRWEFQFPFMISGAEIVGLYGFLCDYFGSYSEESVGEFYTRDTRLRHFASEHGPGYAIDMNIWLAPLELGVSQHLVLMSVPEADHNVHGLYFEIEWLSGENEAWKRVNRRFFKVLRKEFLIWYSLKEEVRLQYRARTEELLAGAEETEAPSVPDRT